MKKKETYAKAKTLLEKYGETMEPQSEATTTVANVTTNKSNQRQSGSDKPMISSKSNWSLLFIFFYFRLVSPTNAGKLQTTTTQVPITVTQNRPSSTNLNNNET